MYEYQRVAKHLFYSEKDSKSQYMYGGSYPRFNTVSIDFENIFGTHKSQNQELLNNVVQRLTTLLTEIDSIVHDDGIDVTHELVLKGVVQKCNTDLKLLVEDGESIQLGMFRLMIFLQAASHLGVGLRPHPRLRDIFYPVEGTGAFQHLIDCDVDRSDVYNVAAELKVALGIRMDETEAILCEGMNRILQKYDFFIHGQSLFFCDDDGKPWIKEFGDTEWKPLQHIPLPL